MTQQTIATDRKRLLVERGWKTGSTFEDRVAWRLHLWGISPADCVQQMRVGRYRIDFAFPDVLVALEADGWQHERHENAASDAVRDRWLRRQGWLVLRVNDEPDDDVFEDQVLRAVQVVRSIARLSPYLLPF